MEEAWIFVHLDPRKDGVNLPEYLRTDPRLILQYGYNMPVPIADLVVDKRGISATLSFRRVYHATFIPWAAVFGMTDGEKRHYVWEADIPPEILEGAQSAAAAKTGQGAGPPKLTSVPEEPEQIAKPQQGAGKPGKKPRPSHLKLVD